MKKEVMAFRAGEETRTYLRQLITLEQERAEKFGITPLDRSAMINEAVKNYYFLRMDARDNEPVTENAMKTVEQVFRQNIPILVNAINSTHYDIKIVVEYVRLLCKALNFDNTKDGLDVLLNAEMPWDVAIPEKVDRELRRKKYENNG